MKRVIAVLLTVVSVLACLTVFAGCTDEGMLKVKQTFCNHRWEEKRFEASNCKYTYDVTIYSCSKCQKEKREEVAIPLNHDWQELRIERADDCQHQDLEIWECPICKLQQSELLDTYGPHIDRGDGICQVCGKSVK